MKHIHRLDIPLYNWRIVLCADTSERAMAYMQREYDVTTEDLSLLGGACFHKITTGVTFIWVPLDSDTDEESFLQTLAHEVLHACIFFLEDADIAYDGDNSEPLAYLLGYIISYFATHIPWREELQNG